jgi:hypothetical protein
MDSKNHLGRHSRTEKGLENNGHQDDFVRRDDFKEAIKGVKDDMVELKQDMKDGFTKLEDMMGLIFKKIDNKADK